MKVYTIYGEYECRWSAYFDYMYVCEINIKNMANKTDYTPYMKSMCVVVVTDFFLLNNNLLESIIYNFILFAEPLHKTI